MGQRQTKVAGLFSTRPMCQIQHQIGIFQCRLLALSGVLVLWYASFPASFVAASSNRQPGSTAGKPCSLGGRRGLACRGGAGAAPRGLHPLPAHRPMPGYQQPRCTSCVLGVRRASAPAVSCGQGPGSCELCTRREQRLGNLRHRLAACKTVKVSPVWLAVDMAPSPTAAPGPFSQSAAGLRQPHPCVLVGFEYAASMLLLA